MKHILVIPPNSSIKCEDYDVFLFARMKVKNTNEIKRIRLEHRIKYEIPALNYQNVYTNTSEIVQGIYC